MGWIVVWLRRRSPSQLSSFFTLKPGRGESDSQVRIMEKELPFAS